jgi:hypothetical protein
VCIFRPPQSRNEGGEGRYRMVGHRLAKQQGLMPFAGDRYVEAHSGWADGAAETAERPGLKDQNLESGRQHTVKSGKQKPVEQENIGSRPMSGNTE